MLAEIYINNFVLIEELRLQFGRGLNVLTGETGAGKSIIIDALSLVMGERVKNDFIRDTSKKALIEAVFILQNESEVRSYLLSGGLLEDDEDMVVISRELLPEGRSTARINGHLVNVSALKQLAPHLVDMHLQHENLNLLKPGKYLEFVDNFSPLAVSLRENLHQVYLRYEDVNQELMRLREREKDKAQRMEFLDYQIKEIESAGLTIGEEEELESLASRVRNAANLSAAANKLLCLLYSDEQNLSAYDQISAALDTVTACRQDNDMQRWVLPLQEMYYSLQDLAGEISQFRDSLDFEPGLLDELEQRLFLINRLKNKYGEDIEGILGFLDKCRAEWDELNSNQEQQDILMDELSKLESEYRQMAAELNGLRQEGARILETRVHDELAELNMPHIQFAVSFNRKSSFGPYGLDEIDFLFSPNPGEDMRPLSRIASGGEISRFILALKKALAEVYQVPTLIFDEIDVGVGGTALAAMAKKLGELGQSHQVILVTHSPQVASYASAHYLIEKQVIEGRTCTIVRNLGYDEKIKELARMLGGENYSEITLQHAGELLDNAILNN